jgi:hypothetical protein
MLDGYKPALLIATNHKFFENVASTDFPRITPFDDEQGVISFSKQKSKKKTIKKKLRMLSYVHMNSIG